MNNHLYRTLHVHVHVYYYIYSAQKKEEDERNTTPFNIRVHVCNLNRPHSFEIAD